MTERHLTTKGYSGYELIDSGEHEKLERFGEYVVSRPDTQAIWKKHNPSAWELANATFVQEKAKGSWKKREIPEAWPMKFQDATFIAKLTNFKHVGLFPEQAPNWEWAIEQSKELGTPNVLNLFGYTGAASVVAAKAGANVTHVDSSKAAIAWCKENAAISTLPEDAIRYMHEDARSFVKREVRRGARYEGILLDPPAFGRGAKDEVWKIEEDLLPLLASVKELLSEAPGSFFILNGYAAGYAPRSFANLVADVFPEVTADFGELRITASSNGRELPCGMYVRFVRA